MTLALALVIALVAAALVLEPLLRAASGRAVRAPAPLFADGGDGGDGGVDEDDPRLVRRDRALAALKEIEFDRATAKLSDDDYQKMKAQFTSEALEALRNADSAVAPTDDVVEQLVASARTKGASRRRFCVECGAVLEGNGRFCLECGAPAGAGV